MKTKQPTTGSKLRDARKKTGLTQRDAARQCGLTPAYLCFLEHDRNEPTLRLLRRIAKVYGVPHGELIGP